MYMCTHNQCTCMCEKERGMVGTDEREEREERGVGEGERGGEGEEREEES